MQNQVNDKDQNIGKINPTFIDTDDFDLETFTVKPLSKGLGFHQSKERVQNQVSRQKISSSTTQRPSAYNIKNTTKPMSSTTVSQSELSAFYETKSPTEFTSARAQEKTKVCLREAHLGERLLAWSVDFILLVTLSSALMVAFLFLSGIGFDLTRLMTIFTGLELGFFIFSLYSLMNIFYFTILELVSTPGKSLFKLKTLDSNQGPVTAGKTFVRAVVSLLSCLAVGLPLILDFQSHLSDTKVFKEDV